jgi:hypothetical protein
MNHLLELRRYDLSSPAPFLEIIVSGPKGRRVYINTSYIYSEWGNGRKFLFNK